VARALHRRAVGEGFAGGWPSGAGLTPAQIRTAVRFARLVGDPADPAGVESLILRQLGNADRALGGSAARDKPRGRWSRTTTSGAERRVALRGAAHRRGAAPPRPRHAVFPRQRRAPARRRWPSTSPPRCSGR
jgi:hypothetical protein